MNKYIFLLFYFVLPVVILCQSVPSEYYTFVEKADSLYKLKDYRNSALMYSKAFRSFGNKGFPTDRYNAARSWSLTNTPDSAFDCLDRIVKKRLFTDYDLITKDTDFTTLYSDKRWQKLLELLLQNKPLAPTYGWQISGSKRKSYSIGVDKGSGQEENNAATIKSIKDSINGFGALMQSFKVGNCSGKKVRFSGYMKSSGVKERAGFWLRAQSNSNACLAIDNMSNRPIKGTTEWRKYEIVLYIPPEASKIAFGAMLHGTGQIWFDKISLEIMDFSPPSNGQINDGPLNLDFEK